MAVANAQACRTKHVNQTSECGGRSLDSNLIEAGEVLVDKIIAAYRFEVSLLVLFPGAAIKRHTHSTDEEYYYCINEKVITKCKVGDSHGLINDSEEIMYVVSVKYAQNPMFDCLKATILYHMPQNFESQENGTAFLIDIFESKDKKVSICILTQGAKLEERTHPDYKEFWLDLQDNILIAADKKAKEIINNTDSWKYYIVTQYNKT